MVCSKYQSCIFHLSVHCLLIINMLHVRNRYSIFMCPLSLYYNYTIYYNAINVQFILQTILMFCSYICMSAGLSITSASFLSSAAATYYSLRQSPRALLLFKEQPSAGDDFFLSRSSSLLSMQWLCSMHSDWSTAISSAYTMSFIGVTSVLLLARVMQFQRSFLDRLLNIIIWKWHSVHIYTWLWRITSTLHDQTLLSLIRRTNNYNVWISIDCLLYASK